MEALAAHRLAAVAAAALALCALAAPAARADGDPASDVLISEPVFLPYYVKVRPADAAELRKVVAAAKRKGYTVRVALTAHGYDLGSAGSLLGRPQSYAKFLAQELANFNTGWVLSVMPNGYGIYHCVPKRRPGGYSDPCEGGRPAAADVRVLAALPKPGAGPGIVPAATEAVRRLAALHGAKVDSGGGGTGLIAGAAGGAALLVLAGVGVVVVLRRRGGGATEP